MSDNESFSVKRRDILRTIGTGAAVGVVGSGTAGAAPSNRHIVGAKNADGKQKAKERATKVYHELDFGEFGKAVAGQFSKQARKALSNNPNIEYIEVDGRMQAIGETLPWGIDRTDADLSQDDGYTGDGAHVAILDSGIDSDHPDLEANLGTGKAYVTCSGCSEPWDDDNDHGTHCAGIAAAVDNSKAVIGVAPSSTLHAVKVLDSDGWGYYSDIAAGIEYTADQGWDVASMSIGGSSDSSTMDNAIQYATKNGVLCVAAAGNSGPCSDCVMFPARHPDVVAVSATDSNDDLASFSSTGPEIDLAAPGYSILSTVRGGTAYFSGTSMACPHVSGAAGVLMANGYSNTEARKRLEDTAEDIGLASNEQGNGLLDVETAIGSSEQKEYNIDTLQASNVGSSSATLEGELTGLGGADSAECYFKYWEKGNKSSTTEFGDNQTLTSPGVFTADVSDLSAGTTYVFAARGKSSTDDWNRGERLEFTTTDPDGTSELNIETLQESNVGSSTATLEGELTELNGADSAECYFKYWKKGAESSTSEYSDVETLTAADSFAHDVSGLSSGETYVFAARGESSDGEWDRGSRLEFTTGSGADDTSYNIETKEASNVASSSATLNGTLDGLSGADSAECYFKYWKKGAESSTSEYSDVETLTAADSFAHDVSGLSSGETYVFAARGESSDGEWDRGSRLEFMTE